MTNITNLRVVPRGPGGLRLPEEAVRGVEVKFRYACLAAYDWRARCAATDPKDEARPIFRRELYHIIPVRAEKFESRREASKDGALS
jgi:hypothetical protein